MNKRTIFALLIVSLTLIGCTDTEAPEVVIHTPTAGENVTSPVLVTGEAADVVQGLLGFSGSVSRIYYTLNGGAEQEQAVEPAQRVSFSFEVSGLVAGSNTIQVSAVDDSRHRGFAEVTVNYQPPPSGVTGIRASVRDARTNQAVTEVAIAVTSGGSPVAATVTYEGEGNYRIGVPAGQSYSVQFSRQGYLPATYTNVGVSAGETTQLEALLYIPQGAGGTGNASGTVTDALSGQGASGATLTLRSGLGVRTGTAVATTTTGSNGAYSFMNQAAGYYTIEVSKSGYVTGYRSIIVLGGETTANQNATISPVLPEGQTRIVLTWWEGGPRDLDAHLTGPRVDGSGRFHVYFGARRYQHNGITQAELDLDNTSRDTDSRPETITIYVPTAGEYLYSVHDYTNRNSTTSGALASSRAKVEVYRGSTLLATYNVPANGGNGTLWTVFSLNGGSPQAQPVAVNTIRNHSEPGSVQSIPLSHALSQHLNLFEALPAKR